MMGEGKKKAVVFDLDDTLVSERQYIQSGYRAVSAELSQRHDLDKQPVYEMLLDLFADSPKNVFNRLYDKLHIPYTEKDIRELVELYRNHDPDIDFYDDVIPCVQTLKANAIMTGIITDGYISTQRAKLNALDAYQYFDHIVITEELGREYWKPHPRAFEMMKETLGVDYENMVYIGDNPEKDFFIGSIYPIKTARISREGIYSGAMYLGGISEDYTIDSLADILTIMNI